MNFKITDSDVGENYKELKNPEVRLGARGIVIRADGKIAIFNKVNKNEYKLPGGGIEGDELPEIAFKREVLEETGCVVEIDKQIGVIEECKSKTNFKQVSYVFVGRVVEDTNKLNLTKKETTEGARLLWETPENALKLVTECYDNLVGSSYDSLYSSKFMVLRDRKILEYYLNNR